ncbi:TetR family transcriptional regulator [Myxococcus sp. CA051A]|uniref:TetR family transcriptional regulator n=1 Tax=unclassified Myxococcus TaxID=2648731 RepID=UPI00157B7E68|nr:MULTISPECIES: TetR family transcriptional regulator [unclassified Myxococcus]NTX09156.1 TetR family transcriptional regulator [Myxococcus sp. CA056]NTX61425.1 TetR family transcriptional regulator [Myxococcus sp. CA051A]
MSPRPLALLLCLLCAVPVWAASGLEAARSRAQAARTEARSLRTQQQALRDELQGVAARIEALKAERKGRLTTGTELEAALRRSQELSGSLTGLAQSVSTAEGESERAHLALHQALSDELARLRGAWDQTADRGQRATLLEALRTTRTERDAVRAALPASRVPMMDKATAGGDDPEDLLEQADTLRDAEDKVRERLKSLRARITEVREEKDLDRRMSDFLGEESMFDEQDRRLRLRMRSGNLRVAPSDRGGGMFAGEADVSGGPPPGEGTDTPGIPTTPQPGTGTGRDPALPEPEPARATDRRPQVDGVRAQTLAAGGPVDLAAMEAEAKRLEALAHELDGRAGALEHRAQELATP